MLMDFKRKCLGHVLQKKDGPDNSGVNAAAQQEAQISQEALNWYEQQYAASEPDRAAATQRANNISDAQVAAMDFATQNAQHEAQRNQSIYEPLEDQIVSNAQNYDTPERRAQAVAQANASVESAFDRSQTAQQQALMRAGNSPSGVAAAALAQDASLQKAKMLAGASQQATQNVEQQGYAREMDAAGLGKGVVSSQATQQQIATGAGGAGLAASGAGLQASYSGMPIMQAGFGSAMSGQQAAGNLYSQAAQISAMGNSSNAAMVGGIGGIMEGLGAMGYSSKRVKMRREPVSDDEALAATNRLKVEKWDYKPGVADSGTHVGPYAEDVQREFGDGAAPGGKMVHMPTMADNNAKAIRALTQQLEQVEGEISAIKAKRTGKSQRRAAPAAGREG
jgi:hypothetical protein